MILTPEIYREILLSAYAESLNMESTTMTQDIVNEALDQASKNGYTLDEWSLETIAEDLIDYDKTFEGMSVDDLAPFVEHWLSSKRRIL